MKSVILTSAAILGSLSQMAPAASQTTILKNRIAEKDRVIRSLEKEIESMHALLRKNNLRPTTRATSSTTRSSGAHYTIRKGDNLSKIAKRNGVSLRSLLSVNKGINPRRLKIGQKIKLPSSAKVSSATSTPAAATAAVTPSTDRPSLGKLPEPIKPSTQAYVASSTTTTTLATTSYTVQRKDTLYGIAKKHKTSIANILELNQGLNPNKLRIGQKIKLAGSQKADQIAQKAPQKPAVTKKAEPAKSAITQKEVAQKAPQQPATKTAAHEQSKEAPKTNTQTVKNEPAVAKVRTVSVTRQMTFGDFAKQYSASVEQLNEMNNLRLTKSTVLAQGSELYVPNAQH